MTIRFTLPLLEPHRSSLEKCVYCPKLSRAACPVSNVEASETVTPWGKMSMAYFVARGDVPTDPAHGEPAWACSACYACRERCDHKNEVATVLVDARADLFERGAAPPGAREVARRWPAQAVEVARMTRELTVDVDAGASRCSGRRALLVGCGYVRRAPEVARDAVAAATALLDARPMVVESCCGLPLAYAGARAAFTRAARRLAAEVRGASEIIAVDPGCARALGVEYARLGLEVPPVRPFVDLVHAQRDRLRPLAPPGANTVRYHDPCQLGRGLGRYDAPREILAKLFGGPPEEFLRTREHAVCSGGGGLLPATRPETSRAMADERIAEHHARGGGTLVTACAQSLHRFRKCGEPAEDLTSLVARALRPFPERG